MTWIVSVHSTGGSMAEAIDPEWIFSVRDEQQADQIEAVLQPALDQAFGANYYWVRTFEVLPLGRYKLPAPTGQALASLGPIPQGKAAIDFTKIAEDACEGVWPEKLPPPPPPVDPEEEAAAIASIIGH